MKGDQRLPHDSGREVEEKYLEQLGVKYFLVETTEGVDKLAADRGYKNRDQVTISPDAMGPVYEDKVKSFFHEHLHEDEEIRYVREGRGYFDVRGRDDEWVRIRVEKVGYREVRRPRLVRRSWLTGSGIRTIFSSFLPGSIIVSRQTRTM